MREVITECWNRGLTEDEALEYLKEEYFFIEIEKLEKTIKKVFNDLRHIEDMENYL